MLTPQQIEETHFDTKMLRYLLSIVDESSLTRAAEKHFLSQPAMSRYLKNIENQLKTPLFTRVHNQLHLTESGMIFMNGVRSILHIEQEMEKELQQMTSSGSVHQIRIAVPAPFLRHFTDVVLPHWNDANPAFIAKCSALGSNAIQEALRERHLDLGIFAATDPVNAPLECLPFAISGMACCMPASWDTSQSISEIESCLAKYNEEGAILISGDTCIASVQKHLLREYNAFSSTVRVSADLSVLCDLIRIGYGPVLLPELFLRDFPPERTFALPSGPMVHFYLAWEKGRHLSKELKEFIDIIMESSHQIGLSTE